MYVYDAALLAVKLCCSMRRYLKKKFITLVNRLYVRPDQQKMHRFLILPTQTHHTLISFLLISCNNKLIILQASAKQIFMSTLQLLSDIQSHLYP